MILTQATLYELTHMVWKETVFQHAAYLICENSQVMEKVKHQKVFQKSLWPIEYYKKIQTQQKCQPLKAFPRT